MAVLLCCNLILFVFLRTESAATLLQDPDSFVARLLTARWSASHLLLSCITHLSVTHLLFNVIAFWSFAGLCAWRFSWRHWLLLYWGAGVAGVVTNNLIGPMLAIGASGALSGVIGWYGAYAWNSKARLRIFIPFLPALGWSMTPRGMIGGFVILNLLGIVLDVPLIAFGAHLGGTLFGAALGIAMHSADRITTHDRL